jgi:hypothetical protein
MTMASRNKGGNKFMSIDTNLLSRVDIVVVRGCADPQQWLSVMY